MAQPVRSTPRAERTRAAILDAAEAVFAEQGFAATRLGEVAERVGIRRASIVYYFRDKAELYDAVLADSFGGLREVLEETLLGAGSLAERIEAAISAWIDYLGARPSVARLLLREVADARPGCPPPLLDHIQPIAEMAATAARAEPDGSLGEVAVDPAHLASIIAGATVFLLVGMPILVPNLGFDPLSPASLDVHRRELLRVARRLLDAPAIGQSTPKGSRRD